MEGINFSGVTLFSKEGKMNNVSHYLIIKNLYVWYLLTLPNTACLREVIKKLHAMDVKSLDAQNGFDLYTTSIL